MEKNVKNNVTRIVLSVLILALIPVMHLLATERPMDYEEYFSQEREIVLTSSKSVNQNWLRNPTHIYDEILDFYKEKYPDIATQISTGNVYQERVVDGEVQLVCLAKGEYTESATSGSQMYLVCGEELSRWDLNTLESEIIFNGKGNISKLYAYDDVVFFQAGTTIYRYYIPSEKMDILISDSLINFWKPISNQVVYCIVSNSEYLEAVQASGVGEHDILNDSSQYASWLNQKYDFKATLCNEIFTQKQVGEALAELGIMPTSAYYYNAEENLKSQQYTGVVGAFQSITAQSMESVQSRAGENDVYAFNTTSYATGSYFTNNGAACASHSSSTSNCKTYLAAKQCEGYARYLFYTNTGVSVYGGQYLKSTLPSNSDPDKMADYFQAAKKPMIVRFYTTSAQNPSITHTIYVYYADDSTIRFSHGNADGHCVVINDIAKNYNQFTSHFSSFCGFFEVVEGINEHTHTPGPWEYDARYHWKTCKSCGSIMNRGLHSTILSPCACGKITTPQMKSLRNISTNRSLFTWE